jgi:hypothetical protein
MKGLLADGPAAGHVVEVGDPPFRRGVIVLDEGAFGEDVHRDSLSSIDSSGVVYSDGGKVRWPPEAWPGVTTALKPVETTERN